MINVEHRTTRICELELCMQECYLFWILAQSSTHMRSCFCRKYKKSLPRTTIDFQRKIYGWFATSLTDCKKSAHGLWTQPIAYHKWNTKCWCKHSDCTRLTVNMLLTHIECGIRVIRLKIESLSCVRFFNSFFNLVFFFSMMLVAYFLLEWKIAWIVKPIIRQNTLFSIVVLPYFFIRNWQPNVVWAKLNA